MKIVVTDANILIGLCEMDLIVPFFALPYEISVVEAVWKELSFNQQQKYTGHVDSGRFGFVKQEDVDLMAVAEIKTSRNQLSIADCSSLVYAEDVDGILLTSDKNLRTTACSRGVDVHGHLWVFDEMVGIQSITPQVAIEKLTELRTVINPKLGLPANECERRLKVWQEEIVLP